MTAVLDKSNIVKVSPDQKLHDHVYVWLNEEGRIIASTGDSITHEQALELEKEKSVALRTRDELAQQRISQVYREEHVYVVSSNDWLYTTIVELETEELLYTHQTTVRFPKRLTGKSLTEWVSKVNGDDTFLQDHPAINFDTLELRLVQWTTGQNIIYLGSDGNREIMFTVDHFIGHGYEFEFQWDYVDRDYISELTTAEEYDIYKSEVLFYPPVNNQ